MADDIERVRQAALKDPAQLVRFADLLVAEGRSEEAVQACRKGLAQRPDDVPLRLALGRALSAAGQLEEAQAALLDAVARQQRASAAAPRQPSPRPAEPRVPEPQTEDHSRRADRPGGLFESSVLEDSGPVIQDPSIEEIIELPTRVGSADVPGPHDPPSRTEDVDDFGFEDEAPTSVAAVDEVLRSPQRAAREPPAPRAPEPRAPAPRDPARVTTLPQRNPTRASEPRSPEPRSPVETAPMRGPDRVTTLPERNAGDRGQAGASAAAGSPNAGAPQGAPAPRGWPSPPSDSIDLDPMPTTPLVAEPRPEPVVVPRPRPEVRAPAPRPAAAPLAPAGIDPRARQRHASGAIESVDPPIPEAPRPARPTPAPARPAPVPGGPIDLRALAHGLLGELGADDSQAHPIDDVVPSPVPDEMSRAWDARRSRAFVWLWVALVLLSGGIAGGYVYRARERARLLAIAVERADARAMEATADGDFAARDAYAGALRAEPKLRKYTAMVALAAARLAADHGEDTDAAAWAMERRAEKEAQKKAPEPDPRADRDLRQARGLLALARGETCPPLEEKEDGDIAARCALQRGDVDAARRILGDAVKSVPDNKNARALLALASLELGSGDLDAADAAYGKTLTAYPGHPRAIVGRLLVAIERGELPKIPEAQTGGPRQGLTTEAWFHLARGLVLMNGKLTAGTPGTAGGSSAPSSIERAAAELDLARRGIVHDGRLALLYGRARLLQGKVAEAEQAMRIAERLNPNDADVAVLDAEVAIAKGYEEKVVAALSVGAQTPRKLSVLGRAQALTGRYKEAAATLDAALARRPGDAVSITYRAIARGHLGDAAGAQRDLEKAVATLSSTTPHYGLGLLAYERRDLARARAELEKALAGQNAEAFRARALLGRVLRDLGKTGEALAELERVAREAPALVTVHAALGRLYLDVGRDREARNELRIVLDGGNPSADDKLIYADALVRLGSVEQGEHAIDDAVQAGIPPARVAQLRLELSSWKGAKEAALAAKTLEKERRGPAAKDVHLMLVTANAFRRAGDYKHASELFREALLGSPLQANLGIGRIQLVQNDTTAAEVSFRAALELAQKAGTSVDSETEARVGLGRALLARKSSSDAEKILEAGVEKDDGSAEAHYWLARAAQDKSELDKARTHAERAIALDDKYADAFALVGDLDKSMRPPDRARAAYKKYLELEPEGERAKAIKKTLATLK